MSTEPISDQTRAAFSLRNMLGETESVIKSLEEYIDEVRDCGKKLASLLSSGLDAFEGVRDLCDGRPTTLDELVVYLKERPWVTLYSWTPNTPERCLKFLERKERRLCFADPSPDSPSRTRFGHQTLITFSYEGFVLDDYGDQSRFRYTEAPVDQAS